MKRLSFFFILSLLSFAVFSQPEQYFVYIQSEQQQPFFARINSQTYNASRSGYLIIPQLVDNSYEISIGFPNDDNPDQEFVINTQQKDQGYILKKFGEKGWGLFNLHTAEVQMAGAIQAQLIAKANEPKQNPEKNKENQPVEAAISVEAETKSVITRKPEKKTDEGVGIVFIDENEIGIDTIHILIPEDKKKVTLVNEHTPSETKFLEMPEDKKEAVVKPEIKEQPSATQVLEAAIPTPANINGCRAVANDDEFKKLRKAMAAETDDDDMVDEARKSFKTKCFTTQQIRNLGVLFLDDLGKYKFFDLGYHYVSDKENFGSLSTELKGEYYLNRFKAMIQ